MSGVGCILCAQCWACQFGQHYDDEPVRHTWMDESDAAHAGVAYVEDALALSHPCPCWCGRVPVVEPAGGEQ